MAANSASRANGIVAMYLTVTDAAVTAKLRELARSSSATAPLVYSLWDTQYGRLSFSFYCPIQERISGLLSSVALAAADVSSETTRDAGRSLHPRCGLVDHISVQPVNCDNAADRRLASISCSSIAEEIRSSIGADCHMYGWASPAEESLAALRRRIGYFDSSATEGSDCGERVGLCTIGASPPVLNANYQFQAAGLSAPEDIENVRRWLHRQIGRPCSSRGGGLAGVELATLLHSVNHEESLATFEVACNLTEIGRGGAMPVEVAAKLASLLEETPPSERLAKPGKGWYVIGLTPQEMDVRAAGIRAGTMLPLFECIPQATADSALLEATTAPLLQPWPGSA